MNIQIHRKDASYLISQNKIRWALFNRKNILIFIFYFLIGLLLLIWTGVTKNKDDSFWGIDSSLGISSIFLSLFYFSHTLKNRKRYISRTLDYIDKFNNCQSQGIDIMISDSIITYKDFQISAEYKWTNFKKYKVYKTYLFILTDNENLDGIIINKNEITSEQFTELTDFVSRIFEQKN